MFWWSLRNFFLLFPLVFWVGGGTVIAVWVAPIVFSHLSSRTESGRIVGEILQRLDRFLIAGMISVALSEVIKFWRLSWPLPTKEIIITVLIVLLLLIQIFSMTVVSPKIRELRSQIGSFDETPKTDPLRQAFGMWHGISMLCMVICLVLGTGILLIYFILPNTQMLIDPQNSFR